MANPFWTKDVPVYVTREYRGEQFVLSTSGLIIIVLWGLFLLNALLWSVYGIYALFATVFG